MFFQSRLNQ